MSEKHSGFELLGNIDGDSNTYKAENMLDPTNAQDYATKAYIDAQVIADHDTSATGAELDTLTDGSDSSALHVHTIVSLDTDTTGAELTSLGNNSMVDTLHRHSELSASDGTPDRALVLDADGKVGIGTTTPSAKLQIKQSAANYAGGLSIVASDSGYSSAIWRDDGITGPLILRSQSDNTMYIQSGKVGIGTASPTRKLDVESSGVIADFQSTTTTSYVDIIDSASKQLRLGSFGGDVGIAWGGATTPDITIVQYGNVGIGTTGPTNELSFGAAAPTISMDTADASDSKLLQLAGGGAIGIARGAYIQLAGNEHAGAGGLTLASGNNARIFLAPGTGSVGIGVADPHSKLEVAGAISSGTATITASADNTNVAGINTLFINITGDIVLGGLVGGVDGQVIYIVAIGNFINHFRLEHAEGIGGSQDFINHTAADEDISHGGCTYVCNGTNWYDVGHARHV